MPFLPASRTKRNLLKVASLGLAGLLAGLLAGCLDSPQTTASLRSATSTDALTADPSAQDSSLPKSIEDTQIPALRHPPSARHLQVASAHTTVPASLPSAINGY
jgi:hypothetical protein